MVTRLMRPSKHQTNYETMMRTMMRTIARDIARIGRNITGISPDLLGLYWNIARIVLGVTRNITSHYSFTDFYRFFGLSWEIHTTSMLLFE